MPPTDKKSDFIINRRAGTVLRVGEEKIRQTIIENFGAEKVGEIRFIEGRDVGATVKAWAKTHAGEGRGLVIGGGDGTILTAATEILGREDIILGILPLGTQNLLSRRLGFSTDFRKAAAQYKNSEVCTLDVGNVNNMNFIVGLMVDGNSVKFFEARELLRNRKYFSAVRKIFSMAAAKKQGFIVSGQPVSAHILAVMNNEIQPNPVRLRDMLDIRQAKDVAGKMFAQGRKSSGKLSFYAFHAKMKNFLSLKQSIHDGTWTTMGDSVTTKSATELSIYPADEKEMGKSLKIIVDGEIKETQYPLNISIIPKALQVYRPK